MKSKPVLIQYTKDAGTYLKGAIFEAPTPAVAKSSHPDAKIVRYADGEKYVEASTGSRKSKSKTTKKSSTSRTSAAKSATTSTPATNPTADETPEAPLEAVESPTANDTAK